MENTGKKGFHIMAKPAGPACNLRCKYCFYLEKKNFYKETPPHAMDDAVLEAYVKTYCDQPIPEISFVWQGGEPMLAGLDFYRRALAYQEKYAGGRKIVNSIQTNGTLLNEDWCALLKEHNFLVGLSFDGPKFLHDKYRVDASGEGTFERVMDSIHLLQTHDIPFNIMCCVTREATPHGLQIYRFLRGLGAEHIQFSPIVERVPDACAEEYGLDYGTPDGESSAATPFSVIPEEYGAFLMEVFDEWIAHDVGKVFIHNIESVLPAWLGLDATMCIYAKQCGRSIIVEHDGSLFSCDHFMYPEYRIGNIQTDDVPMLLDSERQTAFGARKSELLSAECKHCEVLFACHGGCPKHRFVPTDGDVPQNYLCGAYRAFYRHIHRYMKAMAQLITQGEPASRVMELLSGGTIVIYNKPT